MTATRISLSAINSAIREVCFTLEKRRLRPPCWTRMSENELWRELVACILGSRVRFEVAYSAMQRMDARLLFCEPRRSSHFERYEQDVIAALSEGCAAGGSNRYPFFRTRANQIRRAAERLYGRCGTIRSFLKGSHDIRDIRRKLALEVSGLGPKQASLFLRNIGYTADIAVLDIHILTYMAWLGLTETPIRTVPTVQRYEILEKIFIEHAYSLGYPPEHFDLAIWVVVKVARREQRTWG